MLRTFKIVAASVAAIAMSTGALAQQAKFGTAAEAKAMLGRVISELKANESAAIAKFNKPDGGFRDRDLYVFCINAISRAWVAPRAASATTSSQPGRQGGGTITREVQRARVAGNGGIRHQLLDLWIDGNLPGEVDRLSNLDGLGIRPDWRRRVRGGDDSYPAEPLDFLFLSNSACALLTCFTWPCAQVLRGSTASHRERPRRVSS